jgi:hypothetical protein
MAAGRVQLCLLSSALVVLIFGLQATAQQLDPPATLPLQAAETTASGEFISSGSADVLGSPVTTASSWTGKSRAATDRRRCCQNFDVHMAFLVDREHSCVFKRWSNTTGAGSTIAWWTSRASFVLGVGLHRTGPLVCIAECRQTTMSACKKVCNAVTRWCSAAAGAGAKMLQHSQSFQCCSCSPSL